MKKKKKMEGDREKKKNSSGKWSTQIELFSIICFAYIVALNQTFTL